MHRRERGEREHCARRRGPWGFLSPRLAYVAAKAARTSFPPKISAEHNNVSFIFTINNCYTISELLTIEKNRSPISDQFSHTKITVMLRKKRGIYNFSLRSNIRCQAEGIAPKATRHQDTKTGALPSQARESKPEADFPATILRDSPDSGFRPNKTDTSDQTRRRSLCIGGLIATRRLTLTAKLGGWIALLLTVAISMILLRPQRLVGFGSLIRVPSSSTPFIRVSHASTAATTNTNIVLQAL